MYAYNYYTVGSSTRSRKMFSLLFRLLRLLELVLDDLRALRLLFGCSLFSACDHAVRHLLKVTAVTPIMHRTIGTQALAKASIVSQCLHGHVRASSLKWEAQCFFKRLRKYYSLFFLVDGVFKTQPIDLRNSHPLHPFWPDFTRNKDRGSQGIVERGHGED